MQARGKAFVMLLMAGGASLALPFQAAAADLDLAMVTAAAAAEISGVTVFGRKDDRRTSTATKTDTPLSDVPQSITVIGEAFMADTAMQSMADVVRYVPGVTMGQGEGHRDAPTIRGNASTADFFVDGVRDDVQYYRDIYNAQRVEVLKGPNAMIFGRGGGGGVINRVTKQASWDPSREIHLEYGSYDHERVTADLNQPLGDRLAGRLNLLYEDSGSYRDHVSLERWGISPTLTFTARDRLTLRVLYEHFEDERTVDRGVPSVNGRPARTSRSTFFGAPDLSYAAAEVDALSATVEYRLSDSLVLRNHTTLAQYDKFYQNVFPGGVNPAQTLASLSAYNNPSQRENLFNQTDLVWKTQTGSVKHVVLVGAEFGRQETDNFRNTGFFGNTATSINVPLAAPTIFAPAITFRQSATDADNNVVAKVAAVYVQDQIELSAQWQVIAGLRFDSFDLDFHDKRTGQRLNRTDDLVSPRVGVIYKPTDPISLYLSYSKSFLPSSGDQFASLTATSKTLEPEAFENYEAGLKWEINPNLMLSAAVYQLDRDNTTARDPLNPSVTVQTGSQRTKGFEVGVSGKITEVWEIVGGYAHQEAEITSATVAAPVGRKAALTPQNTLSLWNKYRMADAWAVGLGLIYQGEMFAAIDNAVTLPSFTRVDAAVFHDLTEHVKVQVNVENLLDEDYFPTAHSNNNITPGAPRTIRASLTARF
ncbi:MAG: TonB-dependent siderophore receptor [Phenylobacterium sp.]|uniref:TonB-dependent receptor n=1 Tax=Phenylobacterium sp. TaxID=1871053 RepID=UPI002735C9E6|nr:TonB-dependent siderophore receptor [Phenylobacterium sp.]MDP3746103.1 TonB-dependent siderophore receptor [Phenylobacterium sp.]